MSASNQGAGIGGLLRGAGAARERRDAALAESRCREVLPLDPGHATALLPLGIVLRRNDSAGAFRDRALLARHRARLRDNRRSAPLFDMARFTRALDDLLLAAWENRPSPAPA
jgi:hypothetical protein